MGIFTRLLAYLGKGAASDNVSALPNATTGQFILTDASYSMKVGRPWKPQYGTGPEYEYTISLHSQFEGDPTQYESHVKFSIDLSDGTPKTYLLLIESNPQRQGLGKLLTNLMAKTVSQLDTPEITVILNTPEEHRFYTSVGYAVPDDDIRAELGLGPEDEVPDMAAYEQYAMLLNKKATPAHVIERTSSVVEGQFTDFLEMRGNELIDSLATRIQSDVAMALNEKQSEAGSSSPSQPKGSAAGIMRGLGDVVATAMPLESSRDVDDVEAGAETALPSVSEETSHSDESTEPDPDANNGPSFTR